MEYIRKSKFRSSAMNMERTVISTVIIDGIRKLWKYRKVIARKNGMKKLRSIDILSVASLL
jgi:hypothetical protein